MPGPTHAPDRPMPTRTAPIGDSARSMSIERQRRLRRTLVVGGLLLLALLWFAIKALTGSSGPSTAAHAATEAVGSRPTSSAGASASASASKAASTTASAEPTTVPKAGTGKLIPVAIPGSDSDRSGRRVTFSIDIEGGLGIDPATFAAKVRSVLGDARGWETKLGVHFVGISPQQRAAGAAADIRITLASPDLTDQLCAPLQTDGKVSCNHNSRAVLNALRWVEGIEYYSDLDLYRDYLINHEVGHGLWQQHETCPGPGKKAPVMQQQTLGLHGCVAWPWPQQN